MRTYAPQKSLTNAKSLRQNQTDAEKNLWRVLRNNQTGYKFRRQQPVGKYIADFICMDKNLIVELDGGQHTQDTDRERTLFLEARGFRVIRFWNNDVLQNLTGVYHQILTTLNTSPTSPLPTGEGGIRKDDG